MNEVFIRLTCPGPKNQSSYCTVEKIEPQRVIKSWDFDDLLVYLSLTLRKHKRGPAIRKPFKLFQEGGSSFLLFQLILSKTPQLEKGQNPNLATEERTKSLS